MTRCRSGGASSSTPSPGWMALRPRAFRSRTCARTSTCSAAAGGGPSSAMGGVDRPEGDASKVAIDRRRSRVSSTRQLPTFRHPLPVYGKRRQPLTNGPILALLLPSTVNTIGADIKETAQMTFKIERYADGQQTTLRLIGHLQAEYLEELQAQLEGNGPRMVLDLDEVTLVDVEVVRFLGGCEAKGIVLLHCSPYIREWIAREQHGTG